MVAVRDAFRNVPIGDLLPWLLRIAISRPFSVH